MSGRDIRRDGKGNLVRVRLSELDPGRVVVIKTTYSTYWVIPTADRKTRSGNDSVVIGFSVTTNSRSAPRTTRSPSDTEGDNDIVVGQRWHYGSDYQSTSTVRSIKLL